ncbi:MAG: hypothetical protein M5R40_26570 [Anaerolineae bacterium]|nr:hypothetical protein [Anaerolineae bacterium]
MAAHDPQHDDPPRQIKPDDGIGGVEQIIKLPKIDTLRDPRLLANNTLYVAQTCVKRAL